MEVTKVNSKFLHVFACPSPLPYSKSASSLTWTMTIASKPIKFSLLQTHLCQTTLHRILDMIFKTMNLTLSGPQLNTIKGFLLNQITSPIPLHWSTRSCIWSVCFFSFISSAPLAFYPFFSFPTCQSRL